LIFKNFPVLEIFFPIQGLSRIFKAGGHHEAGQEKNIFFLGAKPGDKNYLQTNGVFLC
jgi:hypothetical protein